MTGVCDVAPVDISTMPELARLADEVARTGTRLVLRRGTEELAVLVPARSRRRNSCSAPLTDEQRRALLSSIGSWRGLIDAEQFKREIKEARSSNRPPVEL